MTRWLCSTRFVKTPVTITSTSTKTYSQAVNHAVNQTLVRSANTSLIALLPVGSILFVGAGLLGAGTLKDLSLALFIGLAVGTYSSIFIAPPVLAQLREKEPAMQALAKRVNARSGGAAVTLLQCQLMRSMVGAHVINQSARVVSKVFCGYFDSTSNQCSQRESRLGRF